MRICRGVAGVLVCLLWKTGAWPQAVAPTPSPQPSTAPLASGLTLTTVYEALRKRSFAQKREDLAKASWALDKATLELENEATLSVRSGVGARLVPKETGPGVKDGSKGVLLPRAFELYQTHSVTASKPLYDFGRLDAKRKTLEARKDVLPFERELEDDALKWKAASLLLDVRAAALEVEALEAQAKNAEQKKRTLEAEYRKGLRSEADRTRAEADALRVALPLERARQAFARAWLVLFAEMGQPVPAAAVSNPAISDPAISDPAISDPAISDPAISDPAVAAPLRRDVAGWRELLSKKAPSDLPESTRLELARLEAERGVVLQNHQVVDASTKPRILGELGAQLPGELFPYRTSVFGQVTFVWDIPWNGATDLEREKIARQAQSLDLEAQERRQSAQTRLARAEPPTEAYLSHLELLERQRVTLESLRSLIRKRYAAGRATSLELSSVEDELLSNATETQRLQATLASSVLALAHARGDHSLAQALLAP